MIPKEMRRTRMVLRAVPCLLAGGILSVVLSMWLTAPIDDTGWSLIASFVIGAVIGNVTMRLTTDWVLAPLFERPARKGVCAYSELNPDVDLDQLLRTFSELSIEGSVCRDCGMDDQDLNRELRCPPCTALHDQKEAQQR